MDKKRLEKYAELIVKCGLNVQKGQEVVVQCGLDQPEFVTMVVEELYKAGAARVTVEWSHIPVTKLAYTYCSLETLSEFTEIAEAKLKRRLDKLSCFLWLDSDDPDGLTGTDHEKVAKARMAQYPFIKPYSDALENKYQWCIAAVPGKEWAHKVFPELSADEAMEKLWEAILYTSRVDDDPVAAWAKHNKTLEERCKFLNSYKFDRLEYKSSNGTDFTVGLIDKGIFAGGVGVNVVLQGIFIGIITLLSYWIGHGIESGHWALSTIGELSPDGMTMAFLTLSMTEMFHSFNVRSIRHSVFSMKKQNKYLWGAFLFSLLTTLAVIYIPGINTAFEFAAISAKEYFIALGLAITIIPFVEITKAISRLISKKKKNG